MAARSRLNLPWRRALARLRLRSSGRVRLRGRRTKPRSLQVSCRVCHVCMCACGRCAVLALLCLFSGWCLPRACPSAGPCDVLARSDPAEIIGVVQSCPELSSITSVAPSHTPTHTPPHPHTASNCLPSAGVWESAAPYGTSPTCLNTVPSAIAHTAPYMVSGEALPPACKVLCKMCASGPPSWDACSWKQGVEWAWPGGRGGNGSGARGWEMRPGHA